jgi:hypothetical protein
MLFLNFYEIRIAYLNEKTPKNRVDGKKSKWVVLHKKYEGIAL